MILRDWFRELSNSLVDRCHVVRGVSVPSTFVAVVSSKTLHARPSGDAEEDNQVAFFELSEVGE